MWRPRRHPRHRSTRSIVHVRRPHRATGVRRGRRRLREARNRGMALQPLRAESSRLLPQFSNVSFVLCDAYCTLSTIALRVMAASTHAVGMCSRPFSSLSCVPPTAAPIWKTNETEFREAKPNLCISASPNTFERTNQQRIPSLYTAAAHWLDSTVLALASAATPTAVHSPKQSGWPFSAHRDRTALLVV